MSDNPKDKSKKVGTNYPVSLDHAPLNTTPSEAEIDDLDEILIDYARAVKTSTLIRTSQKEEAKSKIQRMIVEARQADEYGNPMIQLNMYEAQHIMVLLEELKNNPEVYAQVKTVNSHGDWFHDVPYKIKKRFAELERKLG